MSIPLFRTEAREATSQAWLGEIILVRPMAFTVLAAIAAAIGLAIVLFVVFGEFTRKATAGGILVPDAGLIKVPSPQAGVMLERFVSEGETVEKGAALVDMGDARHTTGNVQLASAVARQYAERRAALDRQDRFHAEVALAERRSITARSDGLRAEATRIDEELRTLEARVALAERSMQRSRELESRGFISAGALDQRQEDFIDQSLRFQELGRRRLTLQRDLAAGDADLALAESRMRSQRAVLEGQRAALDQEQLEREGAYRVTLTAPHSGIVASILATTGQAVAAGAPLVTIIPEDSRLEAHLYAPSRALGFVRAGQDVLLRYPAFPFQKFGAQKARIVSVSRNALPAADLGFAPPDGNREPLYRIRVALASQSISAYGRSEALQPGMQVEADVLLDRRRLIEWIFEPLISLAGRA